MPVVVDEDIVSFEIPMGEGASMRVLVDSFRTHQSFIVFFSLLKSVRGSSR